MSEPLDDGEREAIALIIAGHPDESALSAQLAGATIAGRRWTGGGYAARLVVPPDAPLATVAGDGNARGAHKVDARLGADACAVLLWLSGGRMDELEIASYGEIVQRGVRMMEPRAG